MTGIAAFILVLSLVQAVQSQRVSNVTFSIAAANRLAFSTNTDATFSFITSATGNLVPGSTITLNYPVGLFTIAAGLGVQISGSVTGSAGTPSSTSITITTATLAQIQTHIPTHILYIIYPYIPIAYSTHNMPYICMHPNHYH